MDELLSVLRSGWALLSGYSLVEQLGIAVGVAAALSVCLSGTCRTAWRTARISWGAAALGWRGASYVLTRLRGGNLPVSGQVQGVLDATRDVAAWEVTGDGGLQSVAEPDLVLYGRRVLMNGSDVLPLVNRRERLLLRSAEAELRRRVALMALDETGRKLRQAGQVPAHQVKF